KLVTSALGSAVTVNRMRPVWPGSRLGGRAEASTAPVTPLPPLTAKVRPLSERSPVFLRSTSMGNDAFWESRRLKTLGLSDRPRMSKAPCDERSATEGCVAQTVYAPASVGRGTKEVWKLPAVSLIALRKRSKPRVLTPIFTGTPGTAAPETVSKARPERRPVWPWSYRLRSAVAVARQGGWPAAARAGRRS